MKTASAHTILAALAVQAATVRSAPRLNSRQTDSACAAVGSVVVESTQQNRTAHLDAQIVYECLQSMPFDAANGAKFIQEARKHIEFQATIDQLRDGTNPEFGHVDLLGGLSKIEAKAQNNEYTSQVDFDTDLRNLINSAVDGHLSIQSLCSDSIFLFRWPEALVSLSNTSTEQPGVYELDSLGDANDTSWSASPINTINGQPAADFLSDYGSLITLRDANARYNSLFASPARLGGTLTQRGQFYSLNGLWTGQSMLNYTYANGTESSWEALAFVQGNQAKYNYTSGQELYDAFCAVSNMTAPSNTTSSNSTATQGPTAPTQTAGPDYFPEPVARDPYNLLAGYYLKDNYSDTAVLFIPSFSTSDVDAITGLELPENATAGFAKAASDFISQAVTDKKSRLIIDLSANGGGTTIAGFNLFKLLFPATQIYSGNRYRNHNFSRLLMEGLNDYADEYDDAQTYSLARHWAWVGQVSPTQGSLGWDSYLNFTGPSTANMTALTGFQNFTANSNDLSPIQGYNSSIPTTFSSPPFAPENIMLITDGFCASTCSIFVNLLTQQGGVNNTLVFGGMPSSSSQPMNLVGGTRGTEEYSFDQLASNAQEVLEFVQGANASRPALTADQIAQYKELMPIPPSDFPLQFGGGGVNLRNGYNKGSDTPLEFESDEASCRLFYTRLNLLNPQTTWVDAADAIWGSKQCAAIGSQNQQGNGTAQNEESSNAAASMRGVSVGIASAALAVAVMVL